MTTYVAGPRGPRPTHAMARASLDPWDALAFVWCGALIVASWPLLANAGRPRLPVLGLTAHVTGTLAGYGVVLMVLSMARLPAAERGVGADVLARWHARGGRTILGLVVVHAWAATAAWAGAHQESFPLAAWQVLGMPGLPAATLATALMVAVAIVSVRAARRR